jgi:hypothetical protein
MSEATLQALQRIEAGQSRIEGMLAQLLGALAEEDLLDPEQPQRTSEGDAAGQERDQGQSLDVGEPK